MDAQVEIPASEVSWPICPTTAAQSRPQASGQRDRYTYDAWGNATVYGGGDRTYMYVGKYGYYTHYQEPGLGLLQLGVRFYDPTIGRFTQRDPAKDGMNWYGYVGGRPLTLLDADGRKAIKLCYNPEGGVLGSGSHAWICIDRDCWGFYPAEGWPVLPGIPGYVREDGGFTGKYTKCSTAIVSNCVADCLSRKIKEAEAHPPRYTPIGIVPPFARWVNCAGWVASLFYDCGYSFPGNPTGMIMPSSIPNLAYMVNDGYYSNAADRWCRCHRRNGWK